MTHSFFFFRQTNQEKITFCLRPASVSATLSWEIRGFRARILKSQINCWKIRRAYCSTFLTVFLVVLTDADTQWPTGVRCKCQVNNVLRELREVEHLIWTFFCGFFLLFNWPTTWPSYIVSNLWFMAKTVQIILKQPTVTKKILKQKNQLLLCRNTTPIYYSQLANV